MVSLGGLADLQIERAHIDMKSVLKDDVGVAHFDLSLFATLTPKILIFFLV